MAARSIRWPVAKHLVELLDCSPLLAGVLVAPGWPGEKNITPEMVWLNTISTVDLNIPVGTGGRKHRADTFQLRFITRVVGRTDLDATQIRLAELDSAAEDVLAEDPTLGAFDGVVSAELVDRGQQANQFPEGLVGDGFFVVEIESRLS